MTLQTHSVDGSYFANVELYFHPFWLCVSYLSAQYLSASTTSSLNSRIGQLSLGTLASINLFDINMHTADASTLGIVHLCSHNINTYTYVKIHTL